MSSSTSSYGSYGVQSSKLALSPDASIDAASSLYGDPSVVAGIGALPLTPLQNSVIATSLSNSTSLDSVNTGLSAATASAAAATAVSASSLQQQQQLINDAAAASSAVAASTTTVSLTTSGGAGGASQPSASSVLGSGFGAALSVSASKATPHNLQMPIMNHQYLMSHGMPQFAYGLPQQAMAPAYGYEDISMMQQRFPVFQPSTTIHTHLAASQGRTPNGTSTPGLSTSTSGSHVAASTSSEAALGSSSIYASSGTSGAQSSSDRYSTRNGDDASPAPTSISSAPTAAAGSVTTPTQPYINTALPPGYAHAYGTTFPAYMMPQYGQYATPMYPAVSYKMPPVTNNHSSGYGKSYSATYGTSAGRYDHTDSLSAGDYKSAYSASLSGAAGKLSTSNSTMGDGLVGGTSGYSSTASSSKTSLQMQQQAAGYGTDAGKVAMAGGAYHPQHAANTPPPPGPMAAYIANLAGGGTLGGAPVAAPQAAAYPSYLPTAMMHQPTAGHQLLQQLQDSTRSTPNQTKMSAVKTPVYGYNWNTS